MACKVARKKEKGETESQKDLENLLLAMVMVVAPFVMIVDNFAVPFVKLPIQ
jgi:hypothetical protein